MQVSLNNIMPRQALTVLTFVSIAIVLCMPSVASAGKYGRTNYSTCTYSADCPQQQTSITAPVPQTPPAAPQTATIAPATELRISFSNLDDTSIISTSKTTVTIRVEKINTSTGEQLALSDIGWVALYADETLVATDYNVSANGNATFTWDVLETPGETLRAVVFDKNGTALARTEVHVTYSATIQNHVNTEPGSANTSRGGSSGRLRQGGFLSIVLGDTGSLGDLGKITKPIDLPPVAEASIVSFPFWLFFMLICIALRLLWQAYREILATRRIRNQIELEKEVDSQKVTFISLVSHYLNTPFSLISNATEMFSSIDRMTTQSLDALRSATKNLQASVLGLIERARSQSALDVIATVSSTTTSYITIPVYRTPSFLIPVVGVAVVVAITNLLLQVATTVSLNGIGLLAQAVIFTAVAVFLLLAIRNRRLHIYERQLAKEVLGHQRALDESRNAFIYDTASELRSGVDSVLAAATPVRQASSYKYLNRGILQFQGYIDKFELAHQVGQKHVDPSVASPIDLHTLLSDCLAKYADTIANKKLTIQDETSTTSIRQNQLLYSFVVDSVIHNAIKFSQDAGQITLQIIDAGKDITLVVSDTGIGIAPTKLTKIFDPFNRATSVTQFDYEGMGFSLYLSRLIILRLGGDIAIHSREGEGTTVSIQTPKEPTV